MKQNNIIKLRKEQNIIQGKMANILGISQQAYSYYENGKRQIPDDIKIKLANFFNVSVDYILGNEKEQIKTIPKEIKEIINLENLTEEEYKKIVKFVYENELKNLKK